MSSKSTPELRDNFAAAERSVLERIRGPALALLSKIKDFVAADAQPVIKIRTGNQTIPAGPTTAAPILCWSSGGFELSACVDEGQEALSLPLEQDHGNYFASGKIADPASPGLHERSFAVSLPFQKRKKVEAGEGQLYLGSAAGKMWLKMHAKQAWLEIEVGGDGAQIRIGFGAVLAAARATDPVGISGQMATWVSAVTAATFVAPLVGTTIGTITSGSDKTVIA